MAAIGVLHVTFLGHTKIYLRGNAKMCITYFYGEERFVALVAIFMLYFSKYTDKFKLFSQFYIYLQILYFHNGIMYT